MKHSNDKPMWLSSIYVQIDNPNLESHLFSLAKQLECELLTGDTSDIIAIPCFAIVVDRTVVGRKWWREYIEYRSLTNDKTPCIVIDNTEQQDDVKLKNLFYTDNAGQIGKIVSSKKRMLNRFDFYYSNPLLQRVKMEIAIVRA